MTEMRFGTLSRGAGTKTHAARRWTTTAGMGFEAKEMVEPLCNTNPASNHKHTWSDDTSKVDCKACQRSINGDNWKPGYGEIIKAAFGY